MLLDPRQVGAVVLLILAAAMSVIVASIDAEQIPNMFVEFIIIIFIVIAGFLAYTAKQGIHAATKIVAVLAALIMVGTAVVVAILNQPLQILNAIVGLVLLVVLIIGITMTRGKKTSIPNQPIQSAKSDNEAQAISNTHLNHGSTRNKRDHSQHTNGERVKELVLNT